MLVAESLDGTTWVQPFAVPRGIGSRVDRPRATVFFEPVHVVRTLCQHSHICIPLCIRLGYCVSIDDEESVRNCRILVG